jgi:ubiquinone/menaquinone biosynthesis C-methylase UbiE
VSFLEQTRMAWETQAESYDRTFTPLLMQVANQALTLAGVGPGTQLVDIAAGGGAVSLPAAQMGADVQAIDYSEAMVRLLSAKARGLGLGNLDVRVMDGTDLAFDDGTFDVAASQLGIMLFPDRSQGLREMARVIRPGGKGIMVVFGPPDRVQPLTLFFKALVASVPGFSPPANSPLFALKDPEVLRAEMQAAGFGEVTVDRFEVTFLAETGDALWDSVLAGAPAITGLMKSVSEQDQAAARRRLNELVASRFDDEQRAALPMAFNIAIGVR